MSLRGRTVLSSDDDPGPSNTTNPNASTTPAVITGSRYFPLAGAVGLQWPEIFHVSGSSPPTTPTVRRRLVRRNSLPASSPIPTSPDESPVVGPSRNPPLDLPPLSSTREEKKAINYSKGQRKRNTTLAEAAAAKQTKEEIFDSILKQLADNKLTFGDLMLYIFDPIYKQGLTRWHGFFRQRGLASKILDFWVSRENSETAREEVSAWASDYAAEQARAEAKEITKSRELHTASSVDGAYVDGFSMQKMYDLLWVRAKTAMKVLDAFATSARNARIISPRALPNERCYKNNFSRRIMAIYLYASGAQRQTISVLAHLGISESYQNLIKKSHFLINRRSHDIDPDDPLPATPPSTPLSGSMRDMARSVAATGLYAASYDNINMVFRAAEQVLGKNRYENGTCATIWPLWKARLEDIKIKELNAAFDKAPPLSIKDILLSAPELQLMDRCLRHCILRIIVEHGGEKFQKFRAALDEALPVTPDKIDLHQTPLHPLPAWNIDQATIIANEEVVEAVHEELKVKGLSHWNWVVKFFCGDQLTIARLCSLLSIRAGHEGGYSGFGWGVWMPGFFHGKIADMHGFFVAHWGVPHRGTRNPGSLFFHNTHLHRAPIVLSSLPPFRVCRDLAFVSLYARDSIETFEQLEAHAAAVQQKYANGSLVSDLRWKRAMADGSESVVPGDEIYENACLLLRDALVSREFTDSIKAGDSGRIVLVLKLPASSYRGNGRTKYAYEMMHLIHNLTHVWPPSIRKIVLNNWLVNPTGNPFLWVEVDLMQEHMNYWIKTIYQAYGSGASWEWLEMISPCISVLRRLSTTIRQVLGSDQGVKHQPADLKEDISMLMASLAEHEVYQLKGRVFAEGDGSPTPDVIAVVEYNKTFKQLQSRLRVRPLVGSWPESDSAAPSAPAPTPDVPRTIIAPRQEIPPPDFDDLASESSADDPEDMETAEDDEPTLTRNTAADVALDMDGADGDEDDFYVDDGAIDNSDDDYVDD
ncbi:hypothetical protein B0H14DRAFT_3555239 [Mycena olivaceomarginata]|nr:hypothetical protein B0H14DRAFT_3555239 [Mycena olivaceomarginata]